ncbi:MAG: class I SAM-dependent methyltransferase, partial [Thermoplasmata archaeon]
PWVAWTSVNPTKFGEIALRHRVINNPLSAETLDRIISLSNPPSGSRVLDVGCGKGEFLLRLTQHRSVLGEGLDLSEQMAETAQTRAMKHSLHGTLTFRCVDAKSMEPPKKTYFLAVCLGATQAFGNLRETLVTLRRWVQPDGWIVIGEGYWKQPPSAEYLKVLGATADELLDDAGNVQVGRELGLNVVEHWSSTDQEWDDFENAYLQGIESYARENPADPDVPEMLGRIHEWRQAYLRWGKETLGFGVYAFRVEGLDLTSDHEILKGLSRSPVGGSESR